MTNLQNLLKAVDELSSEGAQRLYAHLLNTRRALASVEPKAAIERSTPRVIGLHAHLCKATMSDDFLDELPDSFWFGEDKS
jgi:hypothetical protein